MMERTAIPLEVLDEQTVLPQANDLAELMGDWRDFEKGRWLRLQAEAWVDETTFRQRMKGRTGGDTPPIWHDGSGGRLRGGAIVTRVKDVYYMPEFGAVIESGRVFQSAVNEALFVTPSLAKLPFVTVAEGETNFTPPPRCPEYERGTVFLPWGGLHNYGHFTIDALAALAAVAEQGLIRSFPPLVPRLTKWQSDLLDLFLGDEITLPTESQVTRVRDVLFASPMDHYLHRPGDLIRTVGRTILARVPGGPGTTRLYFSRRGSAKRVMQNEAELEERLKAKGFIVIRPEQHSIVEQIQMTRNASLIAGATGAAFANCLFAREGATVIEILPDKFLGIWVRSLCEELSLRWHGYFCRVAEPVKPTKIEGIDRIINLSYELPIAAFMNFLEDRL